MQCPLTPLEPNVFSSLSLPISRDQILLSALKKSSSLHKDKRIFVNLSVLHPTKKLKHTPFHTKKIS